MLYCSLTGFCGGVLATEWSSKGEAGDRAAALWSIFYSGGRGCQRTRGTGERGRTVGTIHRAEWLHVVLWGTEQIAKPSDRCPSDIDPTRNFGFGPCVGAIGQHIIFWANVARWIYLKSTPMRGSLLSEKYTLDISQPYSPHYSKGNTIARPFWRGRVCLLCVKNLVNVLPLKCPPWVKCGVT